MSPWVISRGNFACTPPRSECTFLYCDKTGQILSNEATKSNNLTPIVPENSKKNQYRLSIVPPVRAYRKYASCTMDLRNYSQVAFVSPKTASMYLYFFWKYVLFLICRKKCEKVIKCDELMRKVHNACRYALTKRMHFEILWETDLRSRSQNFIFQNTVGYRCTSIDPL